MPSSQSLCLLFLPLPSLCPPLPLPSLPSPFSPSPRFLSRVSFYLQSIIAYLQAAFPSVWMLGYSHRCCPQHWFIFECNSPHVSCPRKKFWHLKQSLPVTILLSVALPWFRLILDSLPQADTCGSYRWIPRPELDLSRTAGSCWTHPGRTRGPWPPLPAKSSRYSKGTRIQNSCCFKGVYTVV